MEGEKKPIGEFDTDELFKKLSSENKLIAKGAKTLHENDIDGAVFIDMTDEEFNEISGLSFGVKKSLIKYRKNLLEEEKEFVQRPVLDAGPGSFSAANENRESVHMIAKPANKIEWEEKKIDIDSTPGERRGEFGEGSHRESSDFLCPSAMLPEKSLEIAPAKVDDLKIDSIYDMPGDTAPQNEDSDCIPCIPKAVENGSQGADLPRVEYKEEAHPSRKSIILSRNSLVKSKQLKNYVFNEEVKWKEQGKQRSTTDFMKLRGSEIVLEGFVQKLSGASSRFKVTHWTSRYAILLKSGVLLNFDCQNKKLYFKGFADLTETERIEIPQNTSGANALRLDIQTTTKRVVLGFSTEAEMLIWRNEIFAITNDDGEGED